MIFDWVIDYVSSKTDNVNLDINSMCQFTHGLLLITFNVFQPNWRHFVWMRQTTHFVGFFLSFFLQIHTWIKRIKNTRHTFICCLYFKGIGIRKKRKINIFSYSRILVSHFSLGSGDSIPLVNWNLKMSRSYHRNARNTQVDISTGNLLLTKFWNYFLSTQDFFLKRIGLPLSRKYSVKY